MFEELKESVVPISQRIERAAGLAKVNNYASNTNSYYDYYFIYNYGSP